jgi:hypothetical protein
MCCSSVSPLFVLLLNIHVEPGVLHAEKQYETTILTLQARIQDLEREKSALGRLRGNVVVYGKLRYRYL